MSTLPILMSLSTVGGMHSDAIEALAHMLPAPKPGEAMYLPFRRAQIISYARKSFIGIVSDTQIEEVRVALAMLVETQVETVWAQILEHERKTGDRIDAVSIWSIANRLIVQLSPTPPVTGGTTGVPPVTSPAPAVAPPEMDLTVPRERWGEIIRKTHRHMLAYGPPGTGKSYEFSEYAAQYAAAVTEARRRDGVIGPDDVIQHEEVNCTRQTSAAGWVGHYIDTKAGFAWQHGAVARAMLNGVPVVINDVHLCSDDLFDLLFFVLDIRPGAKYSLASGEHLMAQPGFRALLSMNNDPVQVLDEPILDRLQVKYLINTPSEAALKTLDKDIRPMCRVWYEAAAKKNSDPKYTFRNCLDFCELRRDLGDPFMAATLATGNEERARGLLEPLLVKGR